MQEASVMVDEHFPALMQLMFERHEHELHLLSPIHNIGNYRSSVTYVPEMKKVFLWYDILEKNTWNTKIVSMPIDAE